MTIPTKIPFNLIEFNWEWRAAADSLQIKKNLYWQWIDAVAKM